MPISDREPDNFSVKSRLLNMLENLSEESLLILLQKAEELPLKGNRKHLRKLCRINTHFLVQDSEHDGTIHDISYSGVFIKTGSTFSVGNEISLSFTIQGIQEPISLIGKVVRRSPHGIGVEFKDVAGHQEHMIKSFVDSH